MLIFDVELLKVNPPQSEAQKQAQMSDNPDIQAQLRQLEAQMQQAQTASQPAH